MMAEHPAEHLAHWGEIEPLLDQALALAPSQREGFLDTLPPGQQRWRGLIAELLRHEAQAASAGFLSLAASLPEFAPSSIGTPQAPGLSWQAGQAVGPWLLLEELGRGGMASVWRVRPQEGDFQREVALKLPHSPSRLWAERFKRERDILARLNHPGIARLFDAGVSDSGLPWLAMERVQGQDIVAWCERRRADVPQRLGLLLQIADALQYAHSQLVVHRDIKPANVLVQDDGQVRLLDFGIAKLLAAEEGGASDPALTQLGQRPMTPEYASPEQVRGEEPGIASDVYAFAVLAYRLLSGQSPYAGAAPASRHALERAVLDLLPPAPSSQVRPPALRKALRGDLDTIVLKALAKHPDERYATVDAMAADLRRHLAGEPVLARAPSWPYVAGRFVRRHRLGVALSSLAVLALAGTTAWALVSSQQARGEARRAEAMYQFTVGLFNPDQDQHANIKLPDLTLKTVVELGARRVLTQLQDQPEARIRLIQDLVPLSEQLGLIDLSASLAQARIDETKQLFGDQSLAYADALRSQLLVLDSTAQYQHGLEVARQALAIYEARGVQDPHRLAAVHEKLGSFGMRLHPPGPQDAAHLERAVALQLAQPNVVNTLDVTYLQLGLLRALLGNLPAAYQAGMQALELNRRRFGPESWQAAQAESFTGTWADMSQHPAEAESLLRHSVTVTRQVQGADAVGLARSEIALATLLFGGAGRDEARHLMADALRIVGLPQNANFKGLKDQVLVGALGLAVRSGDGPAMQQGCLPYADTSLRPTTPYFVLLLTQACTADALHRGDLAQAAKWLGDAEASYTYFAKAPSWTMGLDLRRGEWVMAQGDKDGALRLWRHALSVSNTTQLAWQSRAWSLIAQHARMDAAERGRLQAFMQQLEQAGGERYYAEYLKLLREAAKTQMLQQ